MKFDRQHRQITIVNLIIFFYLFPITSNACDVSCATCDSTSTCLTCPQLDQYVDGGIQCLTCPIHCSPCTQTTCQACNNNCATCDLHSCQTCIGTNFYIDSSQIQCIQCNSSCATCDATSLCLTCPLSNQYIDVALQCVACPSHCQTCSAFTCLTCNNNCGTCDFLRCQTCIAPNYYIDSMLVSCIQCGSTCKTCNNTGCLTCETNSYLQEIICVSCDTTCSTCNSTQCLTCPQTNQYVQGMQCLRCDSTCSTCNSTICLTCAQANSYVSGTICQPCDTSCSTCTQTQCLTCPSGNQYVSGTQCLLCNSTCSTCNITNCLRCAQPNSYVQGTSCVTCLSHEYVLGTQCFPCDDTCSTCNDTRCLTCPPNSHLSGAKNCLPCDQTCLTCDTTQCLTCPRTYQYVQGIYCLNCPNHCSTCDGLVCPTCSSPCATCNMRNCLSCIAENYHITPTQQCFLCPAECKTCSADNCYTCFKPNYYNYNFSCLPCPLQCSTCTYQRCLTCHTTCALCNMQKCLQCIGSNYYLSSTQVCILCDSTCLTCDSITCLQCMYSNSYIAGQFCITCDSTCANCDATGCLLCPQTNQYIIGNKCFPCNPSCLTCNATTCQTCVQSNFYVIGNICSQCPSHCLTCDSTTCLTCQGNCASCDYTTCTNCISNQFYLNGLDCIPCEGSCSSCDLLGNCLTCPYPLTLVDNQCVFVCDKTCSSCTQTECLSCLSPFQYVSGSLCILCDSPCVTCINKTNCLSCVENMILQNNQCQCKEGYQENAEGICTAFSCKSLSSRTIVYCKYQDCTDGIWEYGEECDNGNKLGCLNCLIDKDYICLNNILESSYCTPILKNCQATIIHSPTQVICNSCISGYYLFQNTCKNCSKQCLSCKLQSDACTQCRFPEISSISKCELCEINSGYYSDLIKNVCYTICGDGIVSGTETCDIGSSSGLGCNNCQLVYGYICSGNNCEYQFGQNNCIYPISNMTQQQGDSTFITPNQQVPLYVNGECNTYFSFTFTNMYKNNDLYFTFSQPLIFKNIRISNILLSNYIDTNFTYNSSFQDKLQLYFNFTKSISPQNTIYLDINFEQQNSNWSISVMFSPNPQEVLSASEVSTQQNIQTSTSTASMAVFITVIITPLFGGFGFILKLMDLIAWLSTFYYINITYPYNVNKFLQNISFNQIFFMLPQLGTPFNQDSDYYNFKSPYKYMQNSVDPLYINNILQPALFILSPVFLYLISIIYQKLLPLKPKIDSYKYTRYIYGFYFTTNYQSTQQVFCNKNQLNYGSDYDNRLKCITHTDLPIELEAFFNNQHKIFQIILQTNF